MALAESLLTDEGVKQLKELFGTLDKDSDGKVDKKEWGHKVKQNEEAMKKFFGGASLAEIGSAFKIIDADGDGSLTWDEFLGAATKKNKAANAALEHLKGAIATEEGMAELKALFATLDKDGDGKISSKEWGSKVTANQEVMAKFFGGATKAEIGAAFKRIDADGNGFLSFDEFVGAAK
jgi:Ca2+-binding EF-hand superfamily protein